MPDVGASGVVVVGRDDADQTWLATRLFMRQPNLTSLTALALPPAPGLVRQATADDVPALAQLLSAAFAEAWDDQRVRRTLTEAADVDSVYLLEVEGRVVATAAARVMDDYPDAGYVHWVGASPDLQGRGLGTAITLRVLQRFMEMGFSQAVLETADFRLAAIRCYLRLGFVPLSRDAAELGRWSTVLPRVLGGSSR